LYLPDDGQVEAPLLAQAFAQAARMLGANVQEFAQVQRLLTEQGKVVGVMTSDGPIYGDRVIVASGTWSGQLLAGVGIELPVYPVKGECFSVLTQKPVLSKTLFTPGCYIVPKAGGRLLVGATAQPGSYDRKVSLAGLAELMERAKLLMPSIGEAEWEKAWSGLRPQTPDGLPYIGKVPEVEGLYAAYGHYRNGILLSPITGKAMADLILGEDSEQEADNQLELDLEPSLAIARAATQELHLKPWLDAFSPDLSEHSKRAGHRGQGRAEQEQGREAGKELHIIEAAH
ncbi:MAG TPA: FAD-dependent oxidoreductase, partial [Bryobacteraceae bacterium]